VGTAILIIDLLHLKTSDHIAGDAAGFLSGVILVVKPKSSLRARQIA